MKSGELWRARRDRRVLAAAAQLLILAGLIPAPRARAEPPTVPFASERAPGVSARGPLASPREFKQLTFSPLAPAARDFGDPSPPVLRADGSLVVYGSGECYWLGAHALEAWTRFLSGSPTAWAPIELYHPDGVTALDERSRGEHAWDVTIERFDGWLEPVLYGGAMAPQNGNSNADFASDNWSRRTYPFFLRTDRWTRALDPLLPNQDPNGWVGHNYGHHFVVDDADRLWVFYERVSEAGLWADGRTGPKRTELFARQVYGPTQVDSNEIAIFKHGDLPYPATVRDHGDAIVEGPRPFRAEIAGRRFWFVSFIRGNGARIATESTCSGARKSTGLTRRC